MTIVNREKVLQKRKIEIDLTGPQGNAFVLLGYVKQLGKQLHWDAEKIKKIQDEMMDSDYEHLLAVLDREFGDFVDFLR
jgi:hypothetical protein